MNSSPSRRRLLGLAVAVGTVAGLAGCASPTPADYANEKPVLSLRDYFNGRTIDVDGGLVM